MTFRTAPELIAHKRDGGAFSEKEIADIVARFVRGQFTDYQMAALAMAIYWRGMLPEEIVALTLAMRDSGRVIDLGDLPARKVDKHSTGGVGDKVSLCLAPLVAACGVAVPMVSGRGLGHTGGTLDKLEAIPGFSVQMSIEEFRQQVRDIGCALIGQTADIAPADKKLYALRDVTATIESIPLITASILSKKLAEGIDGLVLDVKVGRGAFMKTEADARKLAESLVRVGRLAGKQVTAVLTDMRAPLGRTIGNALETREALEVLLGGGPADLVEITLVLGAEMLMLGGVASDVATAREMLSVAITSGRGSEVMERIVRAQGGDPSVVRDPGKLARAPVVHVLKADREGFVSELDALALGLAGVALGAGREHAADAVDPAVGFVLNVSYGDKVSAGDPLLEIHARNEAKAAEALDRIRSAISIADERPAPRALVIDTLR